MNFLCDLLSLYCLLIYICIFIHEDSITSITSTYISSRFSYKCRLPEWASPGPQGGGRQDLTGPSPGKARKQHDPTKPVGHPKKWWVCFKKGNLPPKIPGKFRLGGIIRKFVQIYSYLSYLPTKPTVSFQKVLSKGKPYHHPDSAGARIQISTQETFNFQPHPQKPTVSFQKVLSKHSYYQGCQKKWLRCVRWGP